MKSNFLKSALCLITLVMSSQTYSLTIQQKINDARKLAKELVVNSIAKTPKVDQVVLKLLNDLSIQLNNPKIKVKYSQQSHDFISCSEKTMALVYVNKRNIIKICRKALLDTTYTSLLLAEVLIHEYFHTMGYSDECKITDWQTYILEVNGHPNQFMHGYHNCDII